MRVPGVSGPASLHLRLLLAGPAVFEARDRLTNCSTNIRSDPNYSWAALSLRASHLVGEGYFEYIFRLLGIIYPVMKNGISIAFGK